MNTLDLVFLYMKLPLNAIGKLLKKSLEKKRTWSQDCLDLELPFTLRHLMEANEKLLSIPVGGSQYSKPQMMPMYTAALFGNHEVVKYMYERSNDLIEGGWTPATRAWLLEKCVDNNMFGKPSSSYTFFTFCSLSQCFFNYSFL